MVFGSKPRRNTLITLLLALIVLLFLIIVPKKSIERLEYSIIEEYSPLVVPTGSSRPEDPPLIIVAARKELQLPRGLRFPEQLMTSLEQIDFDKNFLILV